MRIIRRWKPSTSFVITLLVIALLVALMYRDYWRKEVWPYKSYDNGVAYLDSLSRGRHMKDSSRLVEAVGTDEVWARVHQKTTFTKTEQALILHAFRRGDKRFCPLLECVANEQTLYGRLAKNELAYADHDDSDHSAPSD